MTICNDSKQPKTFTLRGAFVPGTKSNGLIGDIRAARKKGYYLTPFGWLKVDNPVKVGNGYTVFWGRCLSYDLTLMVERYNNNLGIKEPGAIVLSTKVHHKYPYLKTNRGFK